MAKDAYNTLPPTAAERSIVAAILGDALSRSYFQFFAGNDLEDALQALKKASEIGFSSEPPDFFSLERLLLDVHLARDVAAIYPGSEASFLDIVKHADNIVGGTDHENGIFRAVGAISAVIRERCVLKDVKDLLKELNTALAHLHSTSLHFSGAGFVEFELAFARVVLQGVLWNQGADIELVSFQPCPRKLLFVRGFPFLSHGRRV